ncbi:MAG TPA: pyruvate formate lyase family protein [Oscillospiraceae bacterium]|nr:pyruvate formate lyase family protein [Oscillospiraceae bacterium]HPF55429.1 pyruvate formate lyase family protein [Clostridiales bacterium]HPK34465.1 pyruvate formate lyase family protein [Oscillospiraceae bacterium]HPR76291.1 pyruvate formate lyase family protein [Oscillospiraceae bacterium]
MLTYRERAALLHQTKIQQTLAKKAQRGYIDCDDNGGIPLPEGFHFEPVTKRPGVICGAEEFSINLAKYYDECPLYVDPVEILAGRHTYLLQDIAGIKWEKYWPDFVASFDEMKEDQEKYHIITGIGANQHFAPDYQIGAQLGFSGLLEKLKHYREMNDPSKYEFYDAEIRVVEAIIRYIGRHLPVIKQLMEDEKDPNLRQTLAEMYECNVNLMQREPRTFLEMCQWMGWFQNASWTYNREGAGMQLDQFLYPFYLRDKAAGLLDDDKATFILANLMLLNPHYYQIGGPDAEGKDKTNELSFLVLEAGHWLNITLNVTIRLFDGINQDLFRKGVEYLFEDGNGWPRFSGDKGLMNFTKNRKMTAAMARDRVAVGCHWNSLPGLEYTLNDTVKINVAKVFEVAFKEISAEPEPTVEKLWERFEFHLNKAIDVTAKGINFQLEHMHEYMPELVLNLISHNTVEQGLDMTQCAEYFNLCIDGAGLATVADSFAALQQRVEDEKVLTWQQVTEAMEHDFEGAPYDRIQLILKSSDRYCQGNSRGDQWANKISRTFSEAVHHYPMPDDRILIPGWFSWANTLEFGAKVGATPDGRKSHAAITHGANPNTNFRRDGAATAVANGIAAIQPGYGNTAPWQLELDPGLKAEEGGVEKVMALLKGHVDQGGTLINVNILNKEKILDAHKNPEKYPDLVVRVTGFTAYFMMLSPEFRQLVVDRILESL